MNRVKRTFGVARRGSLAHDQPVRVWGVATQLLARMRASTGDGVADDVLRYADLTLDLRRYEVRRGARVVELTPTELALLQVLLRNAERVVTREEIFAAVWGFDFGPSSNRLNVYVGYLRAKTEAGGEPRLVHTVRGVGYVLRLPS